MAIVKISSKSMSIQNLVNCPQGTSKDYWKVNCGKFGENEVAKIIIQFAEAVTRGVLLKKVFLKVPQNSQENTCARVSFLIKLQANVCYFIKKEPLAQVLSCEFSKNY